MMAATLLTAWTIARTGGGALANERVANITGTNPYQINPWYAYGTVGIRIGLENGAAFTGFRVYGAHSQLGFAAAGAVAEAIAEIGNPGGAGTGLMRQFKTSTIPAGVVARFDVALSPIPRFLLLEYDMAAAGAGDSTADVTLHLWGFREVSVGE